MDKNAEIDLGEVSCAELYTGITCWCKQKTVEVENFKYVVIRRKIFREKKYGQSLTCAELKTIQSDMSRLGRRKLGSTKKKLKLAQLTAAPPFKATLSSSTQTAISLATEKRSSSAKNKKLAIFSEFHNFLNRKKTFFREIRKEAKLNSRDRGCFSSLISRCDLPNAASKNKLTLVEWSKCFDLPIQHAPPPSSNPSYPNPSSILDLLVEVDEKVTTSPSGIFSPKVTQIVNERASGSFSSSARLPCHHEKEIIASCHKKQKTTTRTSAKLASSRLTTGQTGISFGDQLCRPLPSCSISDPRLWRRIQCDAESSLCWCVDTKSGAVDNNFRVKARKGSGLRCRRQTSEIGISGCSANVFENVQQKLGDLMIEHFGAHPETQVSVMMENNEIMAKYRHKGALPAAWFFSVHDTSSRRKKKDTREKDNVWRKSEQALARRQLTELLRNLESAKCVRKFIAHCDSIGDAGRNDRKIG
ncbi:unnamed protein product, partial [Oikopleura dioica]